MTNSDLEPPRIILASTSPRRRELLSQIGVRFEAIASGESEDVSSSLSAEATVLLLAERKATALALKHRDALVIGGDTVISLDGAVIGKPSSSDSAALLLKAMSGRTHQVVSGVALLCADRNIREVFSVTTDVSFGSFGDDVIKRYVATGEPLDKAGGYAIQGAGALLVESVRGSYYNVVGLPLFELARALRRHMGDHVLLRQND